MTRRPGGRTIRRACSRLAHGARRRLHHRGEGGFILLESMIAITVITIVMGAVGVEFVSGLAATSHQRAQQTAVQLADTASEHIRALDPRALLSGRDTGSVEHQFKAGMGTPAVKRWLDTMSPSWDEATRPVTGVAGQAAVPFTTTQTPGSGTTGSGAVSYTVDQYLGRCYLPTTGTQDCEKSQSTGATAYLRAVVAVSWSDHHCGTSRCVFVTSTLVSDAPDPTFQINAMAHSTPVIVAPAAHTGVVGDTVTPVQLTVKDGTGVPVLHWGVRSGSLPPGLSLSDTGEITGTLLTPTRKFYVATVEVTDAFVRSDTAKVTWVVRAALQLTDPGAQASVVNQPTSLTLHATGGSGAGYSYQNVGDPLPVGLHLDASSGVISGTPTTVKDTSVQVQVTDSASRTATRTFMWTIGYPPLTAGNPGTQTDTVSTPIVPVQLTAADGDGQYVWTEDPDHALPAGLSISATGLVSGTVQATSPTSQDVTLTVSDPTAGDGPDYTRSVTFTWSIVAKPSLDALGAQTVTAGQVLALDLHPTCPNPGCTFTVADGPSGFAVDGNGRGSWTIGGPAKTYPEVTLRATDRDGAVTTTDKFTMTVLDQPMVVGSDQRSTRGGSVDVALTTSCPHAPCSYQLTNAPAGLVMSGSRITGTVTDTAQSSSSVTVTVRDDGGVSVTSVPFTWTVLDKPSLIGVTARSVGVRSTPSIPITYSCPAAPCAVTVAGTLMDNSVGVGLSTTAVNASTNTTRVLNGLQSGGTVYLNGLVNPDAAAGSPADVGTAYGVKLVITDANGVSSPDNPATYTAYSTPSITTPDGVTAARGDTASKIVGYTCASETCTIRVTGLPPGIGLSRVSDTSNGNPSSLTVFSGSKRAPTLYIDGTVAADAEPTKYLVEISITASGLTITSAGIWTVS